MPMPPDLVVKKTLNSRSASSGEIPTPQSVPYVLEEFCARQQFATLLHHVFE